MCNSADGSAEGALHGSGFFIAPRLVMTAAHVVDGQSELIIVRGKNGGGTSGGTGPFGRFTVRRFRKHGRYDGRSSDFDIALIEVPASPKLADVVRALNVMGATPQDLLAILQAIKAAGALNAELEVI